EAALAHGDGSPVEGFALVARALVEGRHTARLGALGRLDLDDLGAEVGEDAAGELGAGRGEVEDADAGKGRTGGGFGGGHGRMRTPGRGGSPPLARGRYPGAGGRVHRPRSHAWPLVV